MPIIENRMMLAFFRGVTALLSQHKRSKIKNGGRNHCSYRIRVNLILRVGPELWFRPTVLLFVPNLLLPILTPLSLPSYVSLSNFIIAVPMSKCLRKCSCTGNTFPIAILNGARFFSVNASTSAQSVFGSTK